MKSLFAVVLMLCCSLMLRAGSVEYAKEPPPAFQEKTIAPCVKALLDGQYLEDETGLDKDAEGTLEVELEKQDKVYFNLVLKSYVGENEPPLYLRFIKVDQLDIQKVLRNANIGDEIFIEPFSRNGFKCIPSHFVVT